MYAKRGDVDHYPRHIGDIITATLGLTLAERGAYDSLLDQYYKHERPIPLDRKEVYRMILVQTPIERRAVDYVLTRYFTEESDGWHQKRADAEITVYKGKRESAKQSAAERWRHAKAVQERMRTHTESDANALPIPDANAMPSDDAKAMPSIDAMAMLTRGNANQNQNQNHKKTGWSERGGPEGKTPEGQHPVDNSTNVNGKPPAVDDRSQWYRTPKGIEAKAAELQILAAPGETHASLRQRCFERINHPPPSTANHPQPSSAKAHP